MEFYQADQVHIVRGIPEEEEKRIERIFGEIMTESSQIWWKI